MKLRNIACLIVAVMMMAAFAISASAIENVTVSATLPKAETKLATAYPDANIVYNEAISG